MKPIRITSKRIITHKWGNNPTRDENTSSNGFLFGGYNASLANYRALARAAKRDFPKLRDADIECQVVRRSPYMESFIYVQFPLPANTRKTGYRQDTECDWS